MDRRKHQGRRSLSEAPSPGGGDSGKAFLGEVTWQPTPGGGRGFGWMERGERLRERHMQTRRGVKRTASWQERRGQRSRELEGEEACSVDHAASALYRTPHRTPRKGTPQAHWMGQQCGPLYSLKAHSTGGRDPQRGLGCAPESSAGQSLEASAHPWPPSSNLAPLHPSRATPKQHFGRSPGSSGKEPPGHWVFNHCYDL